MGKKEVFHVRSRGYENDPEVEAFELSDIDHALPKIYTLLTVGLYCSSMLRQLC